MIVSAVQKAEGNPALEKGKTVGNTEDFSAYLQSPASLEQIFTEASEKYNVPKNLIKAIAKAESGFNPNATSGAGAQGLMQLMPATARGLGVTDSYDPYQNVMGGTKYISQMLAKYNGDVKLALAAYNAGCGNVAKYGGIPPFEETQNYVAKVMNYLNGDIAIPDSYAAAGSKKGTPKASVGVKAASMEGAEDNYYQDILEQLFSYEDYLKFIDMYTKLQEAQREEEKEEKEEQQKESDFVYSYQGIKYSPAVLGIINVGK